MSTDQIQILSLIVTSVRIRTLAPLNLIYYQNFCTGYRRLAFANPGNFYNIELMKDYLKVRD
jgi:hypothetical protein